MENNLMFREFLDHIVDVKECTLFENEKGGQVSEMEASARDRVFLAIGEQEQAVIVPTGIDFQILCFFEGQFVKERIVTSLQNYRSDTYLISCHKISISEFLRWFEEARFLAEEISLTYKEAEALEERQLKLPTKTTRHYLSRAFQELADTGEEVSDVEKIIEKYCIPEELTASQKVSGELEDILVNEEDIIEIKHDDYTVFGKYGIDISQKTSYRQIETAVKKAESERILSLKTLNHKDMEILAKYGISVNADGAVVGKVHSARFKLHMGKILVSLSVALLTLIAIVYFFWGDRILFAVDDFARSQKNKNEATVALQRLTEHKQGFAAKIAKSNALCRLFEKEYSAVDKIPNTILKGITAAEKKKMQLDRLALRCEKMMKKKEFARCLDELQCKANIKFYRQNFTMIDQASNKLNEFLTEIVMRELKALQQYCQGLQEATQGFEKQLNAFSKAYSMGDKYLQPNPDVLESILLAQQQIAELQDILAQGRTLAAQGDFSNSLHWLKRYRYYPETHAKELNLMQNAQKEMEKLRWLNERLEEEFQKSQRTRNAWRNVREYVLIAGEWHDSLAEKLSLLQQNYAYQPVKRGKEISQALTVLLHRLKKLENTIALVERVQNIAKDEDGHLDYKKIDQGKIAKALQPYFSLDINDLKKFGKYELILNDALAEAKITYRQEISAQLEKKVKMLQQRQQKLETILVIARRKLESVRKIPSDFNLPTPAKAKEILLKAQQEALALDKAILQLTPLIKAGELDNARTLLAFFTKARQETALLDLQDMARDLDSLLQTMQSLKIKRSKQTRELAMLHVTAQKRLARLSSQQRLLSSESSVLRENFPQSDGFLEQDGNFHKKVQNAQQVFQKLDQTILQAEQKWEKGEVGNAYRILEKSKPVISQAIEATKQLQTLRAEVARRLLRSQRKRDISRAKRVLGKIERYTKRLDTVLTPIQEDFYRLEKEFPANKGYSPLSEFSKKTLINAEESLTSYRQQLKEARLLINGKEIEKALKMLEPYEGIKLANKDFFADLGKLERELQDKLHKARVCKTIQENSEETGRNLSDMGLYKASEGKQSIETRKNALFRYQLSRVDIKLPVTKGLYSQKDIAVGDKVQMNQEWLTTIAIRKDYILAKNKNVLKKIHYTEIRKVEKKQIEKIVLDTSDESESKYKIKNVKNGDRVKVDGKWYTIIKVFEDYIVTRGRSGICKFRYDRLEDIERQNK